MKRLPNWSRNVIAILILLVLWPLFLLLLYGEKGTRECSRQDKAKSEVTAIALGVKNYEATYGLLPVAANSTSDAYLDPRGYDELFAVLTGENVRGTIFLDPRTDGSQYVDPWERRYRIALDANYDLKVVLNGIPTNGTVFIYSIGKNGMDEQGEGDDICSWKEYHDRSYRGASISIDWWQIFNWRNATLILIGALIIVLIIMLSLGRGEGKEADKGQE